MERFQKDLDPDQDQDDASEDGGGTVIFQSEAIADPDADQGQHERRCADQGDRKENTGSAGQPYDAAVLHGKRYADGERIDACGDREDEQTSDRAEIRRLVVFVTDPVHQHFTAYD